MSNELMPEEIWCTSFGWQEAEKGETKFEYCGKTGVKYIRADIAEPAVDVEGLKKPYLPAEHLECEERIGWNDCINHLVEKGCLTAPSELKQRQLRKEISPRVLLKWTAKILTGGQRNEA